MTETPSPDLPDGENMPVRVELTPTYLWRRYINDLASASTIAEETGWSSQYVRDRLRQFDIPLRPRGVVKPPLDEATLRAALATGDSVRAIAARAGYSRSGVENLMQRYGLTLPPRPARRLADPELSAALALKYQRGASMEILGAEYGHSADWVRARLVGRRQAASDRGAAAAGSPRADPRTARGGSADGGHRRAAGVLDDVGPGGDAPPRLEAAGGTPAGAVEGVAAAA